MVPTRRRLLAATAGVGGLLLGGGLLVDGDTAAGTPSGWRMFRGGPAGRSYAPDASPPTDGVAVRWKRRIADETGLYRRTAPVVADGRAYVAGDGLRAFDAASGDPLFRAETGVDTTPAVAAAPAFRSATVAVRDVETVRGLHGNGGPEVAGSPVSTTRWTLESDFRASRVVGGSPERRPLVATDGTLLVSGSDGLLALDASSGRVRWRTGANVPPPVVHDGTAYAVSYTLGVRGFDVETGEEVSGAPDLDAPGRSLAAGPDQLVVATGDGLLGVGYDGVVRWRYTPEDANHDGVPVALGDGVAFTTFDFDSTTHLVAVDADDGTERWRTPRGTGGAPSVADGVVVAPLDGYGIVALDAESGEQRWEFAPGDEGITTPWSPVAIVDETVYVVGDSHLYALEAA